MPRARPLLGKILVTLPTFFGALGHPLDSAGSADFSKEKPIAFDSKPIFKELTLEIFNFAKSLISALGEGIEANIWRIEDKPLPVYYARRLCRKWGGLFGAPTIEVMAIIQVESGWNPAKKCLLRAKKGGAWGLGGQMLGEAKEKIFAIKRKFPKNQRVEKVVKRFRGTGYSLFDPELNVMLTTWQIAKIHRKFDDFSKVAAAYHQGSNIVSWRLRNGRAAVSRLKTPRGHLYVKKALKALKALEGFSSFQNSCTILH
jgi:soluble lytic murein transglycosylase-like protein